MPAVRRKSSTAKPDALGHKPLTEADKVFAQVYVRTKNPREAYASAGYSGKPTRAKLQQKLLSLEHYIAELTTAHAIMVAEATRMSSDEVLATLSRVAKFNIRDFLVKGEDGSWRFKTFDELTYEQCAIIDGVHFDKKAKVWGYRLPGLADKMSATQMIGRNHGLFLDSVIEQNIHMHQHAHVDLSHMSDDELARLEGEFARALGPKISRQVLGWDYVAEEESNAESLRGDQAEPAQGQPRHAAGGAQDARRQDLRGQPQAGGAARPDGRGARAALEAPKDRRG